MHASRFFGILSTMVLMVSAIELSTPFSRNVVAGGGWAPARPLAHQHFSSVATTICVALNKLTVLTLGLGIIAVPSAPSVMT
jgi:hypothetical protein